MSLERPASIGLEDRFLPLTTSEEVKDKMQWLVNRLSLLLHEDGRLPQTLKVTMRDLLKDKQSGVKARFHKESRQAKINPRFFKCLSDQGKFSVLQKIVIF